MNFYYEGQLAVIADQLERFDQERFWVVKWAFSAKDSCWIVAEQLERLTKEELLIIKWIFSTKNQLEIVAEQLGHFCHWILCDTGELILLIFYISGNYNLLRYFGKNNPYHIKCCKRIFILIIFIEIKSLLIGICFLHILEPKPELRDETETS